MLILLTQETAEVSPVFLICFVAAIIGLTFLFMKGTSDKATEQMKQRYEGKILADCTLGNKFCFYCFVTEDEFVIQNNQQSFIAYPLANISYARAFKDRAADQWAFAVYDKNQKKKDLDGKMLSGLQNTKKYRGSSLFFMSRNQAETLCEFLAQHAPDVEIL